MLSSLPEVLPSLLNRTKFVYALLRYIPFSDHPLNIRHREHNGGRQNLCPVVDMVSQVIGSEWMINFMSPGVSCKGIDGRLPLFGLEVRKRFSMKLALSLISQENREQGFRRDTGIGTVLS